MSPNKNINFVLCCFFCALSLFFYPFDTNAKESLFLNSEVIINPNKIAPLTAIVNLTTLEPAEITVRIFGQNGARDIIHTFKEYKTEHKIPVLGLYAGRKTKVELTAKTKSKSEKKEIFIETSKISWKGLFIQNKKDAEWPMNWFLSDGTVLDENADIRFVFESKGELVYLSSGEIITENRIRGLKRYTMTGDLLQTYPYPDRFVSFTHGISQRPNGNFLVIGSYHDTKALIAGVEQRTQRDFVIEIDYKTGNTLNTWDISELLNPDRTALVQAGSLDYGLDDFCHLNSVQYNPSDDSMICSCRNSGVFKVLLNEKKLKWLVTPNLGLEKSGRDGQGPEISSRVLKAIDKNGKVLSPIFQKGYKAHSDFKWPTSTHHARYWGKGYLTIFDNSGPIFDEKLVTTEESNASVYKINEKSGTIQHIFKAPQGCFSGAAGSVLLNESKNIVTSFIAQCHDRTYVNTSWGYIRSYDLETKEMRSEIKLHRAGSSYFYEIWPFTFYQTYGGVMTK